MSYCHDLVQPQVVLAYYFKNSLFTMEQVLQNLASGHSERTTWRAIMRELVVREMILIETNDGRAFYRVPSYVVSKDLEKVLREGAENPEESLQARREFAQLYEIWLAISPDERRTVRLTAHTVGPLVQLNRTQVTRILDRLKARGFLSSPPGRPNTYVFTDKAHAKFEDRLNPTPTI